MIARTEVGERLWELREERGWSQKRTAKEAGLSHVTIANLETGKVEPRLPTLRKLARTFGLTVDELLAAEDPSAPLGSALELEAVYVADDATRHKALEAASPEARERLVATIERVIFDVIASMHREGDWADVASDETEPEGVRRVAREQLARVWRHLDFLTKLRAEATGEDHEPPQEERAEFIATHAGAERGTA